MKPVFKPEFSLEEIRRVADFKVGLKYLYDTGIQRGHSTGWPTLDVNFTVRAREWTLVTGIPGHGKSSWLDGLMMNLARSEGWKFAVFSAENLPLERHVASLMAQFVGRPFGPGLRQRISPEEYEWASWFLDQQFRFVCPPEEDTTVDRVLTIAKMIHDHDGINGLVIDPWNELDHARPANMNETEYVSRALTKVRRFARDNEIHVFLVAHPTKLQRLKTSDGREANVYPVPTPYDVSGSAHFRNKADNCICVWRDVADLHGPTQIHVQKIRFAEVGQVGVVELAYDKPTGQFIDPAIGAPKPFVPPSVNQLKSALGIRREPGEDDE